MGNQALRAVMCAAGVVLVLTPRAMPIDTAGAFLDSLETQGRTLTSAAWTTRIDQYDGPPLQGFELRIDFQFLHFTGSSSRCALTMAIQNVFHTFADDSNTISSVPPGLGLYWSSLQPGVPNGVRLDADPAANPRFGRVFENVDGNGTVGNNIYNRQSLRAASPSNPIVVRWTVQRTGIVTNPPGNLTKDLNGNWVPLMGTFATWQCRTVIDGVSLDIATFFLPLDRAEFIDPGDPLTFAQEHFEDNGGALDRRLTQVQYSDVSVSDGTSQFPLLSWWITSRIDDQRGNADNRFGWYASATALFSVCGHTFDPSTAFRDPGTTFFLGSAASCLSTQLPTECDTDCNTNGTGDACDIAAGHSADCDADGTPDECEWPPAAFLSMPDAFCIRQSVHHLTYSEFPDIRAGSSGPPPTPTEQPMIFAGDLTEPTGDADFQGSTFVQNGDVFPYIQHDTTRDLLILHPGATAGWGAAACVAYTAPTAETLHIVGDFARANDFQNAGDGVVVVVFKNTSIDQPLFAATVPSSPAVDLAHVFAGSSVRHFDLSVSLNVQDVIRFAVFAGPPGDQDFSFDASALRFSMARTAATLPCTPGDLNGDCRRDGPDIAHFVNCLIAGSSPGGNCSCADMNGSGTLTTADVPLFIAALLN